MTRRAIHFRKGSVGGSAGPTRHVESTRSMWRRILDDYDRRHGGNKDRELAWFREQPSLRAAIETAARAADARGCRHPHQFRIRRESIRHATAALLAAERRFSRTDSFDAVHAIVADQLHDVAGIGELYLYDTAFRIGAYLGVFPTRVYLHAGTRAGARALNLDYRRAALGMSEIPEELRHRRPHEVEDILCIYRDWFVDGVPSPKRRRSRC